MQELVFTPAAVLGLLSQIDELSDLHVGIVETIDGGIQIQIGDSIYSIGDEAVIDVEVNEDAIDAVSEANIEAYNELVDGGSVEFDDPVESGILKELVKTLAVGGLVRLAGKLMK